MPATAGNREEIPELSPDVDVVQGYNGAGGDGNPSQDAMNIWPPQFWHTGHGDEPNSKDMKWGLLTVVTFLIHAALWSAGILLSAVAWVGRRVHSTFGKTSEPVTDEDDGEWHQMLTDLPSVKDGHVIETIHNLVKNQDNVPINSDRQQHWVEYSEDLAKLSNTAAFPSEIYAHYATAKLKTACGCLPEIGKFYCICDNKLFMWPVDDSKCSDQKEETGSVITAVGICGVDPQFFPNKNAMTLVIATPTYLKIIPLNGQKIDFNSCYLLEIDFAVFCILKGPQGRIFVGTDAGELHLIKYDGTQYDVCSRTSGWLKRCLRNATGVGDDAIVQLCMDATQTVIGGIDEQKNVRFFGFDIERDSVWLIGKTPDLGGSVSLSAIRSGDVPTFLVFSEKGERKVVVLDSTVLSSYWRWSSFTQDTLPELEELNDEVVKMACTTMGLTVLMCKDSIVFIRNERVGDGTCEVVAKYKMGCEGLCFAFNRQNVDLTDCLVWEHFCESPSVHVLTTTGGFSARFTLPYEELQKVVFLSKGCMSHEAVRKWIDKYGDLETGANLVLCSAICPDNISWLFTLLARMSAMQDTLDRDIVLWFNLRVARLVESFWNAPVFVKKLRKNQELKYKVSEQFEKLPLSTIWQLQSTRDIIDKYIAFDSSAILKYQVDLVHRFNEEKIELEKLSQFLAFLLETLKIIGYFSQQKSTVITTLFEFMLKDKKGDGPKAINRLTEIPFCPSEKCDMYLMDALSELRKHFYSDIEESAELTDLAFELGVQAPLYCDISAYQVNAAVECLNDPYISNPLIRKTYLPTVMKTLIENSLIGTDEDFCENIACKLGTMECYDEMIDVLLSRGHAIDPAQRGLLWLKDLSANQEKGLVQPITREFLEELHAQRDAQLFGRVFGLYSAVLERINLEFFMETLERVDDELLQICACAILINQLAERVDDDWLSLNTDYMEKMVTEKYQMFRALRIYGLAQIDGSVLEMFTIDVAKSPSTENVQRRL